MRKQARKTPRSSVYHLDRSQILSMVSWNSIKSWVSHGFYTCSNRVWTRSCAIKWALGRPSKSLLSSLLYSILVSQVLSSLSAQTPYLATGTMNWRVSMTVSASGRTGALYNNARALSRHFNWWFNVKDCKTAKMVTKTVKLLNKTA